MISALLVSLVALSAVVGYEACMADEAKTSQAGPKTQVPNVLYREFERIEPPTEFPPHPRLFLNQEEIDELKAWADRDAKVGEYVDSFVAQMLKLADEVKACADGKGAPGTKGKLVGMLSRNRFWFLAGMALLTLIVAAVWYKRRARLAGWLLALAVLAVWLMSVWVVAGGEQPVESEAAKASRLPTADRRDNGGIARNANKLALAYVLSGERKCAEAAAEILKAYIPLFPDYPIAHFKGKATDSTLGEVQWAANACGAYDLIYNAGVLTNEEKAALEQEVFKVSAEVMFDCNHAYRSNWRIAATGGVGLVGFCIGDRDLIDKALHGERNEDGLLIRDGLVNQMAWSMFADGIYYERSSGYSNICMMFYAWMLEAARHSGVDLWTWEFTGNEYDLGVDADGQFDNSGPKVFTNYLDAVCHRAFGNASIPGIGNDGGGMIGRQFYWAAAWRAKPDPKYAWVFNKGLGDRIVGDPLELMFRSPEMPVGEFDLSADTRVGLTGEHTNACTLLPNGGFAILRQDGGEGAVGVSITYGQYVNGHSHPDQLSICLYANGHIIAPDMKDHGYGHEGHLEWAKQTIAHNTVTVDEVSQYPQGDIADVWVGDTNERPAFGRLTFFHPGETLKAVRAETDSVYEGVTLDRTIALVGSVVVDFYRCRSEAEHQYDYALHIDANRALAGGFGYRHLIDPEVSAALAEQVRGGHRVAQIELTYQPTREQGGRTMHLALMSGGQAEVVTAKGYPNKAGRRRSALIVRRNGTNVDFVSAMSFEGVGDVESVERVKGLPAGLLGVRIVRADGQSDLVISADEPGTYTAAGQTFTGRLALIRSVGRTAFVVDVVK
jgi:hypothetical protein